MGKKFRALRNYNVFYTNPIELSVGEKIKINFKKINPPKWEGWFFCQSSSGNCGWISENYFKVENPNICSSAATITKEYTARELGIKQGEKCTALFHDHGWTFCEDQNGLQGWLPDEVLRPEYDEKKLGRYIAHYSELEDATNVNRDADFGRKFEFERLGIHHLTLNPGEISSDPHAESLEEEFVYVVEGTPDFWVDGLLYRSKPGDCIAFPAGTGICHAVVNNSKEDARILSIGERSKSDNKCYFVDKNLQKKCPIAWMDWPGQEFGFLNSTEIFQRPKLNENDRPKFLRNFSELLVEREYTYTGEEKLKYYGADLGRKLDLKVLGIGHDIIRKNTFSSWQHAHSVEEELVFILKGHPTLLFNDRQFELSPGMVAAFPSGTGHAHCLINRANDDVHFLVLGEQIPIDDKVIYPLHSRRNEICREKGIYWEEAPQQPTNQDFLEWLK